MGFWDRAKSIGGSVLKGAGNLAYDITGADNYMQSWRDLQKGNLGGAFFNLAQGLGESALLAAPGMSGAGRVAQATGRLGRIAGVGGGARGLAMNIGIPAGARAAGALMGGGAVSAQAQRPASAADFRRREGFNAGTAPMVTTSQPPRAAAAQQAAGPVNTSKRWEIGQVKRGKGDYDVRWNGKKWEVIESTRGKYAQERQDRLAAEAEAERKRQDQEAQQAQAGTTLPALSPEEQAIFNEQIVGAQSQFGDIMRNLRQGRTAQSLATQEALRQAQREAAGAAASFRAGAAESGLGLSPGIVGVGLGEISGRLGAQRRAIGSSWADALATLGQKDVEARGSLRSALQQVYQQMAQRRAQTARGNVIQQYGGAS